MNEETKAYLGDGVYAKFDGFGVILTTENGIAATNTIYLEPQVLDALQNYVAKLISRHNAGSKQH